MDQINFKPRCQKRFVAVKHLRLLQPVFLFGPLRFFRINIHKRHYFTSLREGKKPLYMAYRYIPCSYNCRINHK